MNKKEIIAHLTASNPAELFREANQIRKKYCGEGVLLRAVIEFSNCCNKNCFYCGLRAGNKTLKRFRLAPEKITECARKALKDGINTTILQSGDDFSYRREVLAGLIRKIKAAGKGAAVTLSVGERSLDDYKAWRDAGADRILLKVETTSAKLYQKLHPGQSLKFRLKLLADLRKIGYQAGTGNIVGLPGQTVENLADDILFFKKFQPDMIGIGPFMPQRNTPLAKTPSPAVDLVLKVIALTRIVTKNAHIPSTTALNTLDPAGGHLKGLSAGCNVIMVNYTPKAYRSNYRIYDNKNSLALRQVLAIIKKAKRKPDFSRGDTLKKSR